MIKPANSINSNLFKFISDICYLRLDFETFNTIPVTTVETTTCPDTFKITVSVNCTQQNSKT